MVRSGYFWAGCSPIMHSVGRCLILYISENMPIYGILKLKTRNSVTCDVYGGTIR